LGSIDSISALGRYAIPQWVAYSNAPRPRVSSRELGLVQDTSGYHIEPVIRISRAEQQ